MFKLLGSITILVFYVLRLLKIWKTYVDVFKTELTYAMTLCPKGSGVISRFQFCIIML